jgi:hypothetical protein
MSNEENIKCFLRLKPLNKENENLKIENNSVFIDKNTYNLDKIFNENSTQESIFNEIVIPLLNNFIKGYNCTLFAYGQTGSGKTHTILGEIDNKNLNDLENVNEGIIPRILKFLLNKNKILEMIKNDYLNSDYNNNEDDPNVNNNIEINYTLKSSCLELYNESFFDLL